MVVVVVLLWLLILVLLLVVVVVVVRVCVCELGKGSSCLYGKRRLASKGSSCILVTLRRSASKCLFCLSSVLMLPCEYSFAFV